MATNWIEKADSEGQQADLMPEDTHLAKIVNFYHGKKDGSKTFASKGGDPQVLLIFQNRDGEQATQMVTLSEKAAWVMAKILKAASVDLAEMQASGVDISSFADPDICRKYLVDRKLWIEVTHTQSGDKTYTNCKPVLETDVSPLKVKESRAPARQTVPPTGDDEFDPADIPF
jgi:hypothetical protein